MRTLLRSVAATFAVITLAACGAGGAAGGAADPTPTTMSDAEIGALGKQVADCMRAHGIPDLPDPIVENGHLILPDGTEAQFEARYPQAVLQRAQEACQPILDKLPESALRSEDDSGRANDQAAGPQDVDALRAFALCMRENGFADWPDPKPDGSFPAYPTLETEGKSPRFIAARTACEKFWSGTLSFAR
ncbi:MAG TPA: hypothetical protein VI011_02450 [Asanoa sp.]